MLDWWGYIDTFKLHKKTAMLYNDNIEEDSDSEDERQAREDQNGQNPSINSESIIGES